VAPPADAVEPPGQVVNPFGVSEVEATAQALNPPIGGLPEGVRIVAVPTITEVPPTPLPTPGPPPGSVRLEREPANGVLESGFIEVGMVTSAVECVAPQFAEFDSTSGKVLISIRLEAGDDCQALLDRLQALKAPVGSVKARYWQSDDDRLGRMVFESGTTGSFITVAGLWKVPN
jgi:hypothetical protein